MGAKPFFYYRKGFIICKCVFITAFAHKCVKNICKSHYSCFQRYIFAGYAVRITFAVITFMMTLRHIYGDLFEIFIIDFAEYLLKHFRSLSRMAFHLSIFFIGEFPRFSKNNIINRNLAYIMHWCRFNNIIQENFIYSKFR